MMGREISPLPITCNGRQIKLQFDEKKVKGEPYQLKLKQD